MRRQASRVVTSHRFSRDSSASTLRCRSSSALGQSDRPSPTWSRGPICGPIGRFQPTVADRFRGKSTYSLTAKWVRIPPSASCENCRLMPAPKSPIWARRQPRSSDRTRRSIRPRRVWSTETVDQESARANVGAMFPQVRFPPFNTLAATAPSLQGATTPWWWLPWTIVPALPASPEGPSSISFANRRWARLLSISRAAVIRAGRSCCELAARYLRPFRAGAPTTEVIGRQLGTRTR